VIGHAVAPDDRAGFLDRVVRIEKERADRAHALVALGGFQERALPTREHERVVVEKDQETPACSLHALIASVHKAAIHFVANNFNERREVRKHPRRLVHRGVVHDDDLGRIRVNFAQERAQTLKRVIGFVEDGDDDRSDDRCIALPARARRIHHEQKITRAPHVVFQLHRGDGLRVRRPSAV
jgi:hypothetical protein